MSQPLDYKNLAHLRSVIGDSLAPILQTYLDITPALIEELNKAIDQQNADDIKRHAHTLKGSSADIGAVDLPKLFLELETMGREGQVKQAKALFNGVETAYSELTEAIQDYLKQSKD